MEYIDLIRKFWKANEESPMCSSVTNLYLYLLECWDRNSGKDFELSDAEIVLRLKLSRSTIKTAKTTLRNLGLISYQVANGFPTFYKIITDYNTNRKPVSTKVPNEKVAEKENKSATKNNTIEIPTSVETIPIEVIPAEIKTVVPPSAKTEITKTTEANTPTLTEFMAYAKTLEIYTPDLDFALKSKYETWDENNWKNGYGKPITNWKLTLKNTMPHLNPSGVRKEIFNIPTIKRPKSTYNEG
ncbi:MAG: transcriptional regulator [Capnocytophaga sp.]|nr:transcriptional regulator [Capnocytophaga sp.]